MQVHCPAAGVSGFNPPRTSRRRAVPPPSCPPPPWQPRQIPAARLATGRRWGTQRLGSWLRWEAAINSWAGTSFLHLPPPQGHKATRQQAPGWGACRQLPGPDARDGFRAEQRQRQIRARRRRRPAGPGAQGGPRAARHLLRLRRVPRGAAPARPDPLWPRVGTRGASFARPPRCRVRGAPRRRLWGEGGIGGSGAGSFQKMRQGGNCCRHLDFWCPPPRPAPQERRLPEWKPKEIGVHRLGREVATGLGFGRVLLLLTPETGVACLLICFADCALAPEHPLKLI